MPGEDSRFRPGARKVPEKDRSWLKDYSAGRASQGPEATYTHLAGVKYFGHSADYQPIETIEDIFSEVERGRTTFGVVPVENSIEGAVFSTLDSFMKHKVKICGEVNLEILKVTDENGVNRVQFTVRDNGIGMTKDQQSRIFDAFSQAENVTACYKDKEKYNSI